MFQWRSPIGYTYNVGVDRKQIVEEVAADIPSLGKCGTGANWGDARFGG